MILCNYIPGKKQEKGRSLDTVKWRKVQLDNFQKAR